MSSIHQTAPLVIVLTLAGYCCWYEAGDGPVADPPAKDKSSKKELNQALLSPPSTPVPSRNPFSTPSALKKTAPAPIKEQVKELVKKDDLAKQMSHLVLRGTFIQGERRFAMINDRFYGEGDTLAAKDEGGKTKDDNKSHTSPVSHSTALLPARTVKATCQVAKVYENKVVLQSGDETMELVFALPEKRAKSAAPAAAKSKTKTK